MIDPNLIEVTRATETGHRKRWYVPRRFLDAGVAACEICAHDPEQPMLEVSDGYVDAWYCCDQCNLPTCLQHATWWTYGHGGSRILCPGCLDRMREIDAQLLSEGEADEDAGDLLNCATGEHERMRR